MPITRRKPDWLKIKFATGDDYKFVKNKVKDKQLNTICESGKCPNLAECWGNRTATFMILGDICTRKCKFCNVKTGKPLSVDYDEPMKLANTIKAMQLKHCVITSVDRDDLEDYGVTAWVETIKAIKTQNPTTTIETLIPDFNNSEEKLSKITEVKPDIISHNLETVERLSNKIRSVANYQRSLSVLSFLKKQGATIKSGIMLGLGETEDEVLKTVENLSKINCDILTIGQYLQPSKENITVVDYIKPSKFDYYKQKSLETGIKIVESSPLVRSSYNSALHLEMLR